MDQCLVEEQRPGSKLAKLWWYQDGLDLYVMQTTAQEE